MEILIAENDIHKDIKNLHLQVMMFKATFSEKPILKEKVLEHIKKNFFKELSGKNY